VTGEHSGIENPNMPAALAGPGSHVRSRRLAPATQYSLASGTNTAISAPRYPSNIYTTPANWPDELNEYNTLYAAPGVNLGNSTYPTETGHCDDTSSTTCLSTPATEATLLTSESRIMLSHVLANNPRVGYAHQTDLIGPATSNGAIRLHDPDADQQHAQPVPELDHDPARAGHRRQRGPDTRPPERVDKGAERRTVTASVQNGTLQVTNKARRRCGPGDRAHRHH